MTLTFDDGISFEIGIPPHIEIKENTIFVVGNGNVFPVKSLEEAAHIIWGSVQKIVWGSDVKAGLFLVVTGTTGKNTLEEILSNPNFEEEYYD